MFSETFLEFLSIGALVWTGVGALALVALLFRDWIGGRLW